MPVRRGGRRAAAAAAPVAAAAAAAAPAKTPWPCHFAMSDTKLKYLQAAHPTYAFTWQDGAPAHPHVILNTDRAIAETLAFSYMRAQAVASGIRNPVFIDGGGNPGRHRRAGRNIHCARPLLSPADVIRVEHAKRAIAEGNACLHLVQECTCVQVRARDPYRCDGYLLVNSVYYIAQDDIALLCALSSTNCVVSAHHTFPHAYGAFGGGEAEYHATRPDWVVMRVDGNTQAYEHSAMTWMQKSHHAIAPASAAYQLGFRSLTWALVASTADHVVIRYAVTRTEFPTVVEPPCLLTVALANSGYYGKVLTSLPSSGCDLPGEFASLDLASTWACGDHLVVYDAAHSVAIPTPKGFVAAGAKYMAVRKRTDESLGLLAQRMRSIANQYNIPDGLVARAIIAGTCLAYVADLELTVQALHGTVRPRLALMDSMNNALKLDFQRVWKWYHAAGLAAIVCAAAVGVHATVALLPPRGGPPASGPPRVPWSHRLLGLGVAALGSYAARNGLARLPAPTFAGAAGIGLGLSTAMTIDQMYPSRVPRALCAAAGLSLAHLLWPPQARPGAASRARAYLQSAWAKTTGIHTAAGGGRRDPFAAFRHDRSSNAPCDVVEHLGPGPVDLPPTFPSLGVDELESLPLDDKATIRHNGTEEKTPTTVMNVLGIVQTTSIPTASTNGFHAMLSALRQRALAPQPYRGPLFNADTFRSFRAWVLDNLTDIFTNADGETLQTIEDASFGMWNSRQPASLQPLNERARLDLVHGQYNPDTMRCINAFPKVELTTKSTTNGVVGYKARCIQGRDIHFKVLTGPFIYAFSKALCKILNHDNSATYVAGLTGLQIGNGAARASHRMHDPVILETDQESFDTTVHVQFLELEAEVFRRYGATDELVHAWTDTTTAPGNTRVGISFTTEGTRRSGDNQTSVGNSMITLFVMLWYMCGRGAVRYNTIRNDIKIQVMGDDNHAVIARTLADHINISADDVRAAMAELGLVTKAKIFRGENALWYSSFLSSRFYPAYHTEDDGTTVAVTTLAPAIGRYVKYGYYINIPERHKLATLRGDALGRRLAHAPVPFLHDLTSRILELTAGVRENHDFLGNMEHRARGTEGLSQHPDVWLMLGAVYGLDRDKLERYRAQLRRVTSLPARVDNVDMHFAAIVDGTAESNL